MNKKLKQNPIDEYLFETLQMSGNNTKKQTIYILEGFETMEKVWYFNRLKEGKRGINLGYHMAHWENAKKEIGLFKIITDIIIAHICHNCHNWWWW